MHLIVQIVLSIVIGNWILGAMRDFGSWLAVRRVRKRIRVFAEYDRKIARRQRAAELLSGLGKVATIGAAVTAFGLLFTLAYILIAQALQGGYALQWVLAVVGFTGFLVALHWAGEKLSKQRSARKV